MDFLLLQSNFCFIKKIFNILLCKCLLCLLNTKLINRMITNFHDKIIFCFFLYIKWNKKKY